MLYILMSVLIFFIMGLPYSAEFFMRRKNSQKSILEIIVLTSSIGPLVVNFIIFTLGYVGFLSRENLLSITAIIVLVPFFFRKYRSSLKAVYFFTKEQPKRVKDRDKMTFSETFSLSLVISVLLITSFSAFTMTPTARDPYAVWLFYGKRILETKTIPLYYGNAPDISWSGNYPPLISFLAAYYFIILGEALPEAFTHVSWLYGGLTLLATFLLAKELEFGRKCAIFSACLLTTASFFTLELINYGYVTVAWSYYITASCIYIMKCLKENSLYSSLSLGLCLGAALLSTYLSLIFAASLILLLVGILFVRKFHLKLIPRFRQLIVGLTISLVISLPWLIRNYVLLGNPVYPWFYQIFGGKGIVSDIIRKVPQPKYELRKLFIDNTFTAAANEDIGYTLLTFGLAGALYLLRCRKEKLSFFGLLTIGSFALFIISMCLYYGYERYLLMIAPLLAVTAGYLLNWILTSKNTPLKLLVLISIGIFSMPSYTYLVSLSVEGAPLGETMLLKYVECYVDNYLPYNAVVLTNEIQLYFINRKAISVYNLPIVFQAKDQTELINTLKSFNVTHILINKRIDPEVLENTPLFSALSENSTNFKLLLEIYPYKLYEVVTVEKGSE